MNDLFTSAVDNLTKSFYALEDRLLEKYFNKYCGRSHETVTFPDGSTTYYYLIIHGSETTAIIYYKIETFFKDSTLYLEVIELGETTV